MPLLICVALQIYICSIACGNLNHSSKTESRTAKGPTLKTLLVEEPDGVLGIKFYSFEVTVRLILKRAVERTHSSETIGLRVVPYAQSNCSF